MRILVAAVWVGLFTSYTMAAAAGADDTSVPVRPGEPGVRAFWNGNALRFIYAPAFDLPKVDGAAKYRFVVRDGDGKTHTFDAPLPSAALTPVWADVAEGYTTLTVQAVDAGGAEVGKPVERIFYRSPGFSGEAGEPLRPYDEGGRACLKAIFEMPHVQAWLQEGKPDRSYARYCYPNKVIGGLLRAMCAYAKIAQSEKDRAAATEIARRTADYLLSLRLGESSPYAHVPPTYALNVDKPTRVTAPRVKGHWLMVPSAIDAALAILDFHDLSKEAKYFAAAKAMADSLAGTQGADGTWPLMVDDRSGESVAPRRMTPTWVIFFFDRLEQQYHVDAYRDARARAWKWTTENPLKTYQWDGQFEDIALHEPYENLSREQACDVAVLLMSDPKRTAQDVAQAEDLLRFSEDQFVAWEPVKDVAGWERAMPKRRKNSDVWITPGVMEQYVCYDPVARSGAILINAYLKAHELTRKRAYLEKARAIANGMLAGQAWLAEKHAGNGEIPTWNRRRQPINWLNNSYYAAEALLNLAEYDRAAKTTQ